MVTSKLSSHYKQLTYSLTVGLLLSGMGTICIALAFIYGQSPNARAVSGETINNLGTALIIVGLPALLIGFVLVSNWNTKRKYTRGDTSEKVRRLTQSLKESLAVIDSIKLEIEEGEKLLRNLKKEMGTHKELASLSKNQTVAVEYALAKENRRSTVRDVILMLVGVGLGAIIAIILR